MGPRYSDMRQFAPCGGFDRGIELVNQANLACQWCTAMPPEDIKRKLTTILAADVEDYKSLIDQLLTRLRNSPRRAADLSVELAIR
jgi:hypothetical protein